MTTDTLADLSDLGWHVNRVCEVLRQPRERKDITAKGRWFEGKCGKHCVGEEFLWGEQRKPNAWLENFQEALQPGATVQCTVKE